MPRSFFTAVRARVLSRPVLRTMGIGLLASQAIWILPSAAIQKLESPLMDEMLTWSTPGRAPSKIAVCVLERKSRTAGRIAELVRYLDASQAEVIAVAEPLGAILEGAEARQETAGSAALVESLGQATVVLGFDFRDPGGGERRARDGDAKMLKSSMVVDRISGHSRFREMGDFEPNPEPAAQTVGFQAFLNLPSHYGVTKYAYLILSFQGNLYPSLPLRAVQVARQDEGPLAVSPRFFASLPRLTIGEREVPIDSEGKLWIHFLGPAGTFELYDAAEVLRAPPPDRRFEGRIVFVGSSEADRQTPFPEPMTAVEIQANVAANLLTEDYVYANRLRELLASFAATILAGLLVGYLVAARKMAGVSLAVLVVFLGWPGVCLLVFRTSGSHLTVLWPVLAGGLALVATLTFQRWILPRPSLPGEPPEVAVPGLPDEALALWQEKLNELQKALALATGADEIFRLKKQIEGAKAMLEELGG